jgi:hypothetical protein
MANWDNVFPYDQTIADWLAEQGYPRPDCGAGNRLPTTGELYAALKALGHFKEPLNVNVDRFDWDDLSSAPESLFTIRGELDAELRLLAKLSETCGQFYVHPDGGEPAMVVEAGLDLARIAAIYEEVAYGEDGWTRFFKAAYGG